MYGKNALKLLQSAKRALKWKRCSIVERHNMNVGEGSFNVFSKNEISIGIKEFAEDPEKDFPLGFAIAPVVVLCHETLGHGLQYCELFDEQTPTATIIGLSHYACNASPLYYSCAKHADHPHEVAAEYAGIYGAGILLTELYGKEFSDQALGAYMKDVSAFGRKDMQCDTVTDSLAFLDKTFKNSVFVHKPYDPKKDEDGILYLYAERNPEAGLLRSQMGLSGIKQDWIQASAYCMAMDHNGRIRDRGMFQDMDMHLGTAINRFKKPMRPMPKKQSLNLSVCEKVINAELELHDSRDGPDAWVPDL